MTSERLREDDDERQPLLSSRNGSAQSKKQLVNVDVDVRPVDDRYGYGGTDNFGGRDGNGVDEEALETEASNFAKVRMSRIVLPLAIGIFLAAMDGTIVASSYASIGSDLHQLQSTSWVATGYMLTLTSFQPLYGKLSDIFGRKACLIFSYSVFALGSLLCGLATNMTGLIAARALAGLGGGGMTTVVSILISDIVPLRERGTWQGILNIIFASGSATGAPLGGILADSIGWRWAFLIQVPFTLLAILAVSSSLHLPALHISDLRSKLKRVDFLGAALLVLAVFTLLLALDRGGNVGWGDELVIGCAVASIGLFVGFGYVELRYDEDEEKQQQRRNDTPSSSSPFPSPSPSLSPCPSPSPTPIPKLARETPTSSPRPEPFAPRRILLSPSLLPAYLCNLTGIASSMCMLFHAALYFQAVAHQSAAQAGVRLLPAVVGGVAGSLLAGVVMQRTGRYYWLTVGVYALELGGTLGVWGVARWGGVSGGGGGFGKGMEVGLAVGLMAMSLGNGAGITSTLVALIANATQKDQAIATAVSYLFRSLGSVIGISLGSTLVQDSLRTLLHRRLAGLDLDVDKIAQSVRSSLSALDDLPPSVRVIVRASYEDAVQASFSLAVVFAVGALVAAMFVREKPLTR